MNGLMLLHGAQAGVVEFPVRGPEGRVLRRRAVGPERAALYRQGRVEYSYASDEEALEAARVLARMEGIIPALESSHAVAEVMKRAPKAGREAVFIVNLSGRGDKDLGIFQSAGIF